MGGEGRASADNLNVTEELKAAGMEEIDVLTGEDMRKVQRQQYENWFNQQRLWQQERALRDQMEQLDGKRRQVRLRHELCVCVRAYVLAL